MTTTSGTSSTTSTLITNDGLCSVDHSNQAPATHRKFVTNHDAFSAHSVDLCAECVKAERAAWNAAVADGEATKSGSTYTAYALTVEFATIASLQQARLVTDSRLTDATKNYRWYAIAIRGTDAQISRADSRYRKAERAATIAAERAAGISWSVAR